MDNLDQRLRGALAEIANDVQTSEPSSREDPTDAPRRPWRNTKALLVAAAVLAVVAGAGSIQHFATQQKSPAQGSPAAEPGGTPPSSTGEPTTRDAVDTLADKASAFWKSPGFGRVSVDYGSGQVTVLWKGTPPQEVVDLEGEHSNGVTVAVVSAQVSQKEIDLAGKSLLEAGPAAIDSAEVTATYGNAEMTGLVVEVVRPWSGDPEKLVEVAGMPVSVSLVEAPPVDLND